MKLRAGDIIIFLILLAMAVFLLLPNDVSGDTAIITVDGSVVKSLSLDTDCEYAYTGRYTDRIVVKNSELWVDDADCPDKVCVKSGKISKSGQMICCLPNKLLITIKSKADETDVISG